MTPFVIGPDNVPVVTDVERASSDLPLALLSVQTHRKDSRLKDILETFAYALKTVDDPDTVAIYANLVAASMSGTAAAETWRNLMTAGIFERGGPVFEEIHEKGREEGKEEGKAEALLLVLDKQGLALSAEERARIADCHDGELLDRWFIRAISATTTAEVFREEGEQDAADGKAGRPAEG